MCTHTLIWKGIHASFEDCLLKLVFMKLTGESKKIRFILSFYPSLWASIGSCLDSRINFFFFNPHYFENHTSNFNTYQEITDVFFISISNCLHISWRHLKKKQRIFDYLNIIFLVDLFTFFYKKNLTVEYLQSGRTNICISFASYENKEKYTGFYDLLICCFIDIL